MVDQSRPVISTPIAIDARGPRGYTGPRPWLTTPVDWATATAYVSAPPASLVRYDGSVYVCIVAHTSGVFTTDLGAAKWALVVPKGESYSWQGDWAAGTYPKFAVVQHNNAMWASLRSNSVEPGAGVPLDWKKISDWSSAISTVSAIGQAALDGVSTIALLVASYAAIAATDAASVTALSQTNLGASNRSIEYATTKVVGAAATISAIREMWNLDPRLGPVGDWRDKVGHTSWMLESLGTTTRGTQARFPSNGIISITTTLLTVANQDGITGDLWKTFVIADGAGVSYSQGNLYYYGTGGQYCIDFIADRVYKWDTTGKSICNNQNVATYNQGTATWSLVSASQALNSNIVQALATYVAPLTPIAPSRCGLPTPYVIIGSSGNTAGIRHDGAVATFTGTYTKAVLDSYGLWLATAGFFRPFSWAKLLSATAVTPDAEVQTLLGFSSETQTGFLSNAYGTTTRLRRFVWDRGNYANSLHADINSTYNSGWMFGAEKLRVAESSQLLSTPSSAELLTNGSFATDLTGWTDNDVGTGNSVWDSGAGGRLALPRTDGSNYSRMSQAFTTVIGQAYKLTYTISGATTLIQVGTSVGGATNLSISAVVGTGTLFFIATATTTYVTMLGFVNGSTSYVEDISIAGNAISDRSYTSTGGVSNSLVITGTLTRAVVASGAELAMWQGFSAANYGRAAYAANLGFGTSDFIAHQTVVHGATATAAQKTLWDFANPSGGGAYYRLETNASGYGQFVISDGTNTATATGSKAIPANSVAKIVGVRRTASSRIEVYVFVNGELYDSAVASASAVTLTLSNTSAVLNWGARADTTLPFDTASIGFTLGGVSPIAPLPDFIRKAAADEYLMHLANTKILLQGGTNVQGLSDDETNGILYASKTAGGTDRFVGLVNLGALLSTGGTNLLPQSYTLDVPALAATNATLGARASSGPASWGNDVFSWPMSENGVNSVHRIQQTVTLTAASYVFAVPIKAGTRSWAYISGSVGAGLFINLSTGANGTLIAGASGAALAPVSLGNGWYLAQYTFTGTAAAWNMFIGSASADNTTGFTGDGGASPAILIGKPILKLGSTALTAADYVYPLSGSDNHRAVSANDNGVSIVTATGVDQFLPSLALRDKLSNSRRRKVYDPTKAEASVFTTDATVTDLLHIPVPEGKAIRFRAEVEAFHYGGVFTERAYYTVQGIAHRDYGGNVVVTATTTTLGEVTASQDCAASADTTAQTVRIRVTGKAATRMIWHGAPEVWDSGHGLAA